MTTDRRTLEEATYVSLRSYKRDGGAVDTPVWAAPLDGALVVFTLRDSFKVKRIRRDPRVMVAPCGVFGAVSGASGGCAVNVFYGGFFPNKTSASVLKDDDRGNAKVSQQVEALVSVSISGAECGAPFSGGGFPEKCKVSGSVNATEGAPDTVEKGKVGLSCDLASPDASGGTLDDLTEAQVDTLQAAFADRKDVKLTDDGKLTIKTKGVADADDNCSL